MKCQLKGHPETIREATQWDGSPEGIRSVRRALATLIDEIWYRDGKGSPYGPHLSVVTPAGVRVVVPSSGDWIVRGPGRALEVMPNTYFLQHWELVPHDDLREDVGNSARVKARASECVEDQPTDAQARFFQAIRAKRLIYDGDDRISIVALDDPDPNAGGACHRYLVHKAGQPLCEIQFQQEPVEDTGVNGVQHVHLLTILEDRLRHLQMGDLASVLHEVALSGVQTAISADRERALRVASFESANRKVPGAKEG